MALTQNGMGNVNTVTLYVKGVKKKNTKVKWTNIDNIITLSLPKKKREREKKKEEQISSTMHGAILTLIHDDALPQDEQKPTSREQQ